MTPQDKVKKMAEEYAGEIPDIYTGEMFIHQLKYEAFLAGYHQGKQAKFEMMTLALEQAASNKDLAIRKMWAAESNLKLAVEALETLRIAVNDKVDDPGATAFIERTLRKIRGARG